MQTRPERFRSWLPYGFDFESPNLTATRQELSQKFRQLFTKNQYTEVSPPIFDFAQTFSLTVAGTPAEKRSFEFYGSQGENLALSSDTTIQIIKAFANRRLPQELPGRFACIHAVYYNQPWGAGHRREIQQASVELLGASPNRFSEILSMAHQMAELAGQKLQIVYGDARLISHVLAYVPKELQSQLALHFYNKDTFELQRLARQCNLTDDKTRILTRLPLCMARDNEVLDELEKLCQSDSYLLDILRQARGVSDVIFDFSLVKELSYYTGPVFEGYIPGSHERIVSGGIYDELYSQFARGSLPACGMSLNMTALSDLLSSQSTHTGKKV